MNSKYILISYTILYIYIYIYTHSYRPKSRAPELLRFSHYNALIKHKSFSEMKANTFNHHD